MTGRGITARGDVQQRHAKQRALGLVLIAVELPGQRALHGGRHGRHTFDLRFELARALLSALTLFGERTKDDLVHVAVDGGFFGRRGKASQRQLAGEHLIKHHAEAVDVRTVIHAARLLDLLRCHVGRGAELGPALRQHHPTVAVFIEDLGDAEVGDLHSALRIQQDVLRFDVAVQHALAVGILQSFTHHGNDVQRLLWREAPRAHGLPQVHTIDVFHGEEAEAAALAKVMHSHNVGMAEPCEHPPLSREALSKARCGGEGLGQYFERDDAVQLRLPRTEHRTHAPVADEIEDFEIRKRSGDFRQ